MLIVDEGTLSIEDLAQMPVLVDNLTTEECFMLGGECDDSGESSFNMEPLEPQDDPKTFQEKQSSYTEAEMEETLKQARKTKEFPSCIEHGSDFHLEFLWRHFTRESPAKMIAKADKAAWKKVISKHLGVVSDKIGKMNCGPFKFQQEENVKPILTMCSFSSNII